MGELRLGRLYSQNGRCLRAECHHPSCLCPKGGVTKSGRPRRIRCRVSLPYNSDGSAGLIKAEQLCFLWLIAGSVSQPKSACGNCSRQLAGVRCCWHRVSKRWEMYQRYVLGGAQCDTTQASSDQDMSITAIDHDVLLQIVIVDGIIQSQCLQRPLCRSVVGALVVRVNRAEALDVTDHLGLARDLQRKCSSSAPS